MEMNEYQKKAIQTVEYPMAGHNVVYPAIKLAGEAGEVADKIGKHWRNEAKRTAGAFESNCIAAMDAASYTEEQRTDVLLECGDVLWYIAALATEFGTTLERIAVANLEKLRDRKERGVIASQGDHR